MDEQLTPAQRVWNRATQNGGGASRAAGDKALACLLRTHSLAMNGGVFHAIECLNSEELQGSLDGYRYFGLADAADLLARARRILLEENDLEKWESPLDREYDTLANDSLIFDRFQARFDSDPNQFSSW